jgi:hypothetical protein
VASAGSELWLEPHKADDILAKSGLGYPRSSPVFIYTPLAVATVQRRVSPRMGQDPAKNFIASYLAVGMFY